MTWNHRVIVSSYTHKDGTVEMTAQIHECFYKKKRDRVPHSWTMSGIGPVGSLDDPKEESKVDLLRDGLRKDSERMMEALNKPFLKIVTGDDGEKKLEEI